MRIFKPTKYYSTYSALHPPAFEVDNGETFTVETADAYRGKIRSESDLPTSDRIPFENGNPQSGPIYVKGAEKGDVLSVEIVDIVVNANQGATTIAPDMGALTRTNNTRLLNDPLPPITRICPIKDGKIYFSNRIIIPMEPMIGTIGTAPEFESITSLSPGTYGGNMDCPDICIGNKIMLPVNVRGALLFVGDVHAVQGDGEISGSAIEVPAVCVLKADLIKKGKINWPRIESKDYIMTVGSSRPLEDASRIALTELILWLEAEYKFDKLEAYQLCSQVAKMRVAQMVDPLYTIVAKFPKKYLPRIT
ncbi:MAG: acetamidase/formamidase family protein [Nitrososphaeria archaeon]|jgi:acetamidase/formamidase